MDDIAIGRRIFERRQQLGWKQKDLGEKIRAIDPGAADSPSHLSRLEKGRGGEIRHADLRAIAKALGVSWAWIVDGDDPDVNKAMQDASAFPDLARAFVMQMRWLEFASEADRKRFIKDQLRLAEELNKRHGYPAPSLLRVTADLCDAEAKDEQLVAR